MLHAVATPHGIIHVFESHIGIESFCLRIALIHEQSHGRKAHFPALFYHRLEQHLGDTLATEGSRYGEAVDIEFALLCFRIHSCIVNSEGCLCLLDESLAQRLELCTVVRHDDTGSNTLAIGSQERIAVTILAILHFYESFHHLVEFRQCMMSTSQILAASWVHRLHDERCNVRRPIRRSRSNVYLHICLELYHYII